MVRNYDDGSIRMDNIHIPKTKFKWKFKDPCKFCLVKACCSASKVFGCTDVICYEITWARISKIFGRYFCVPIVYTVTFFVYHYSNVYIRETHISEAMKVIAVLVLALTIAAACIKFFDWILKRKEGNL